ncbi:MAG: alpha-amylase family glycosyl hydrolase [Verrucomicrobiota bacterium]
MPASQLHLNADTPLGANLIADGATFRAWAPRAQAVFVSLNPDPATSWAPNEAERLIPDAHGFWAGFVPGVKDGGEYKFYVIGAGSQGFKRDPYARELTTSPPFPHSNCVVRTPNNYPWHDQDFHPPATNDLIIYQFHIGTFYGPVREQRVAKFLDVLDRVEYLAALGVNAIQPLPIDEFPTEHSLGYNGTDYFSPEMDYSVPAAEMGPYLAHVNRLLAGRNCPPLTAPQLAIQINQFKALVDICHLYGLAVILDVVYNHAGGDFGDESIYFFDRAINTSNSQSLYFTNTGWAGGLVFDFAKPEVRQFLIDNAKFFINEYHADGFRCDEVTVIDRNGGWNFCQDLTTKLHSLKPSALNISEYWNDERWWSILSVQDGGAGFDATWHDGLRESVRGVIQQATGGRDAKVNLDALANSLYRPYNFPAAWKAVQFLENHDLLYVDHEDRQLRIATLGDPTNSRSWYARSRARVATGLLLTAPGIPMLFMGQEFLEDKFWSDNPAFFKDTLIWWDGLQLDRAMGDHVRFTQELTWLRRRQPALRGENIQVFHIQNGNRIIAFHRWLEGTGQDVVVVASLNESTFFDYQLGFPGSGSWLEIFNSDIYDHWVNPNGAGNGGQIFAQGPPMHGLPCSAKIVIPANAILVFARNAVNE